MALMFTYNGLFWRVTAKVEEAVVDCGQTMKHRGECTQAHIYPYLLSFWSAFKLRMYITHTHTKEHNFCYERN